MILAQAAFDLHSQRWFAGPLYLTEVAVTPVNSEFDLVTMRDDSGPSGTNVRFVRLLVAYDLDGDGLPDDWEALHGLDPSNPSDALSDADGDSMSNLAEFQGATDPQNIYNIQPGVPPAAPDNVTVFRNADGTIETYWQDHSNDETEFILRDFSPGGTFTELSRVGPDKTHVLIPPGGSEPGEIGVVAHNAAGDSAAAFEAGAPTTQAHPAPPSGLSVTRIDGQRLRLIWSGEATTNGLPNAFRIWRADFGGPWVPIVVSLPAASVQVGSLFYYDDAVLPGRYRYAVAAVNAFVAGDSLNIRTLSDAVDASIAETGVEFAASLDGTPLAPHPQATFYGNASPFVPSDYDAYSVAPPVPAPDPYAFSIALPDPEPDSPYGINASLVGIVPKGKAISFQANLTWTPPPSPSAYFGTVSVFTPNPARPLPHPVSGNAPAVRMTGTITIADGSFSSALPGFDSRSNPRARMIPVNGSASVNLDLQPGQLLMDAGVTSGAHRLTPQSRKSSGVINVKNTNTTAEDMLLATYGSDILAEVRLAPKPLVSRTVAIVKVYLPGEPGQPPWPSHPEDYTFEPPSHTVLQNIFDETYFKQANVKFTVLPTQTIVVNYDIGTPDHILDVSNEDEYNAVLNAPSLVQADYYVFFVKRFGLSSGGQVFIIRDAWGIAPQLPGGGAGRAAFVRIDISGRVCVHEVGHLLGLQHVWLEDFDYSLLKIPGNENERVMGYGSGIRMLKPEWDEIHQKLIDTSR